MAARLFSPPRPPLLSRTLRGLFGLSFTTIILAQCSVCRVCYSTTFVAAAGAIFYTCLSTASFQRRTPVSAPRRPPKPPLRGPKRWHAEARGWVWQVYAFPGIWPNNCCPRARTLLMLRRRRCVRSPPQHHDRQPAVQKGTLTSDRDVWGWRGRVSRRRCRRRLPHLTLEFTMQLILAVRRPALRVCLPRVCEAQLMGLDTLLLTRFVACIPYYWHMALPSFHSALSTYICVSGAISDATRRMFFYRRKSPHGSLRLARLVAAGVLRGEESWVGAFHRLTANRMRARETPVVIFL